MNPPKKSHKPTPTSRPPQSGGQARANALLLEAAEEGQLWDVRAALEAGADVNTRDAHGKTALLLAIAGGNGKTDPKDEKAFERSLRRIGEQDKLSPVVLMLLKAGAMINQPDAKGMTPLIAAVGTGNKPLCAELLRRKANVNYRTTAGLTPIGVAVVMQNPELVDLLLGAGADPRRAAMGGMPLLCLALIRRAADKNEAENMGTLMAGMMGSLLGGDEDAQTLAIIQRLLRAGLNPNEPGKEGITPLGIAAALHSPRVVRLLISQGAKVDASLSDGSTPLFLAASEGRADNGRVLLDAGARADVANRTGDTALMVAAEKASYMLVERLLTAGAKQDVRNSAGKTARDLAVAQHHTAIVRLLDNRTTTKSSIPQSGKDR